MGQESSRQSLAPAVENGTATRAGAIRLEGRMIDIVHYKLAKSILDLLNPNEQNASQK